LVGDLVTARDLTKVVKDGDEDLSILGGVNVELSRGESVALLGPSGSGKSTLLQILGALDPGYGGTVEVLGNTLETMSDSKRAEFRNAKLGFVFQAYNLLSQLTALENVLLPARLSGASVDPRRAREQLEKVGLGAKTHRLPRQLSGGERQRVAIARALMQEPELVLCDEPTGNLDRRTGEQIMELFGQLKSRGVGMIIATHDEKIADTADRAIRLDAGLIVGESP
ncbi:MAG: ABC transporter ATP-binding protein, partial [Myxococcota bacterium]